MLMTETVKSGSIHSGKKGRQNKTAIGPSPLSKRRLSQRLSCNSKQKLGILNSALTTGPLDVGEAVPAEIVIREAEEGDEWAIARVHCDSFYPDAGIFSPVLRVDKVLTLKTGASAEKQDIGAYRCLVATRQSKNTRDAALGNEGALCPTWMPSMIQDMFVKLCGKEVDLLGAVVVDTQAAYIPPRRVKVREFVRYERRKGMAYISCLAVSPAARRQGIATRLLRHAEELAKSWGCRSVALHYDIKDDIILKLYKSLGYREVLYEPLWAPFVMGRPNVRLCLMLKILT
eukprot:jgi/Botrbrau1/18417/Bobra.0072s0010.1